MKIRHRIPVIVGGYFAACAAAGFTLSIVGVLTSGVMSQYSVGRAVVFVVFGAVWFATAVVTGALLPAIAVIWFAERRALDSVQFYLGIGALAGAIAYGLYTLWVVVDAGTFQAFFAVDPKSLGSALVLLFGLPGLAGGYIYWLVAGRNAGAAPRIRPPRGDLA